MKLLKFFISFILGSCYLLLDASPVVLSLFPMPSLVAVLTLREDDIDFPNPPFIGPLKLTFVKACNAIKNKLNA